VAALGLIGTAYGIAHIDNPSLGPDHLSIAAYAAIGLGIGAAGTSFLALLATAAPDDRKAAATITWLMMIFGAIAVTAGTGIALNPIPRRA
jgi:BCD family chlorophyll transporter-like MFS transporter